MPESICRSTADCASADLKAARRRRANGEGDRKFTGERQLDPTRIQIGDLARTEQDPLLARVRSLLRRDYNFSRNLKRRFDVECVYSDEQLVYPGGDGEV